MGGEKEGSLGQCHDVGAAAQPRPAHSSAALATTAAAAAAAAVGATFPSARRAPSLWS